MRRAPGSARLSLGLVLALAGCSTPPPPSFVLVVFDTLRADRLHYAGYDARLSPTFDRLRAESVDFAQARSTSSWTLPAAASLFLSQLPSRHGVRHWGAHLPPEPESLAGALRRQGYRTGAWTANHLMTARRGFDRGFETYEVVRNPRWRPGTPPESEHVFASAAELVSRALTWLDSAGDGPFLIYLHLMENHTPLVCPPDDAACAAAVTALNQRIFAGFWSFTEEEAARVSALYDADVARVDESLGELVRGLDERGRLEDSWLVLTSDHGEMLGEHGLYLHGRALYAETLHVPLLFRPPDGRGSVVDTLVSVTDVAPTILDLAGAETPPSFAGRSLRPALEGRALPERPVVAELFPVNREPDPRQRHLLSVERGDSKLVLRLDGTVERYDRAADPGERAPRPARTGDVRDALAEAGVPFEHLRLLADADLDLSPETLEHLRTLGYLRDR